MNKFFRTLNNTTTSNYLNYSGAVEDYIEELRKQALAALMAIKNTERELIKIEEEINKLNKYAEMAVNSGKDQLARKALTEKAVFKRKYEKLFSQKKKSLIF